MKKILYLKYAFLFVVMMSLSSCMWPRVTWPVGGMAAFEQIPVRQIQSVNYGMLPGACITIPQSFQPDCVNQFRPITFLMQNIDANLLNKTQQVFSTTVLNPKFQKVMKVCLTMFIVFYGIAIVAGLVNPSVYDLIIRLCKFAFVVAVTRDSLGPIPGGWIFFSQYGVKFFNGLTLYVSTILTAAFTPSGGVVCPGPLSAFKIIDEILSRMFSLRFWRIFWAAMGTPPQGWLFAFFFASVALFYIIAIGRALYLYVIASIARTLLLAMAPIFCIFILFNQTRSLFEGWLKQLINFALQPALVLAFVAFFNGIISALMVDGMGGASTLVCYWEVLRLSLGSLLITFLGGIIARAIVEIFYWFIDWSPANDWFPKQWFIDTITDGLATVSNAVDGFIANITGAADNCPGVCFYWWRFFSPVPVGGQIVEANHYVRWGSALPIDFIILMVIILLAFMMFRMGDWAKDVASQLSEGLTSLPFDVAPAGFSTLMGGVAGGIQTAAGAVGTTARVATKPIRVVSGILGGGGGGAKRGP